MRPTPALRRENAPGQDIRLCKCGRRIVFSRRIGRWMHLAAPSATQMHDAKPQATP